MNKKPRIIAALVIISLTLGSTTFAAQNSFDRFSLLSRLWTKARFALDLSMLLSAGQFLAKEEWRTITYEPVRDQESGLGVRNVSSNKRGKNVLYICLDEKADETLVEQIQLLKLDYNLEDLGFLYIHAPTRADLHLQIQQLASSLLPDERITHLVIEGHGTTTNFGFIIGSLLIEPHVVPMQKEIFAPLKKHWAADLKAFLFSCSIVRNSNKEEAAKKLSMFREILDVPSLRIFGNKETINSTLLMRGVIDVSISKMIFSGNLSFLNLIATFYDRTFAVLDSVISRFGLVAVLEMNYLLLRNFARIKYIWLYLPLMSSINNVFLRELSEGANPDIPGYDVYIDERQKKSTVQETSARLFFHNVFLDLKLPAGMLE